MSHPPIASRKRKASTQSAFRADKQPRGAQSTSQYRSAPQMEFPIQDATYNRKRIKTNQIAQQLEDDYDYQSQSDTNKRRIKGAKPVHQRHKTSTNGYGTDKSKSPQKRTTSSKKALSNRHKNGQQDSSDDSGFEKLSERSYESGSDEHQKRGAQKTNKNGGDQQQRPRQRKLPSKIEKWSNDDIRYFAGEYINGIFSPIRGGPTWVEFGEFPKMEPDENNPQAVRFFFTSLTIGNNNDQINIECANVLDYTNQFQSNQKSHGFIPEVKHIFVPNMSVCITPQKNSQFSASIKITAIPVLKQIKYKNHPKWRDALMKIKSTFGKNQFNENARELGLLCPKFDQKLHDEGIPILSLGYDWKRIQKIQLTPSAKIAQRQALIHPQKDKDEKIMSYLHVPYGFHFDNTSSLISVLLDEVAGLVMINEHTYDKDQFVQKLVPASPPPKKNQKSMKEPKMVVKDTNKSMRTRRGEESPVAQHLNYQTEVETKPYNNTSRRTAAKRPARKFQEIDNPTPNYDREGSFSDEDQEMTLEPKKPELTANKLSRAERTKLRNQNRQSLKHNQVESDEDEIKLESREGHLRSMQQESKPTNDTNHRLQSNANQANNNKRKPKAKNYQSDDDSSDVAGQLKHKTGKTTKMTSSRGNITTSNARRRNNANNINELRESPGKTNGTGPDDINFTEESDIGPQTDVEQVRRRRGRRNNKNLSESSDNGSSMNESTFTIRPKQSPQQKLPQLNKTTVVRRNQQNSTILEESEEHSQQLPKPRRQRPQPPSDDNVDFDDSLASDGDKDSQISSDSQDNGTQKKSIRNIKKPELQAQNAYELACQKLQLSAIPDRLPCRDKERIQIKDYIRHGIKNKGSSSSLYISGMPGTGKTATTLEVIQCLREEKTKFSFLHLNAMSLNNPNTVYTIIYEHITGRRAAPATAALFLDEFFKKKDKIGILQAELKGGKQTGKKEMQKIASKVWVFLIDELDALVTKKQTLLYNLFDWPCHQNSRLLIVSIANTMDLPERLQAKIASRIGNNRLVYEPYTNNQIEEILRSRLECVSHIFDDMSTKFVAKKVSMYSGDIRRSLQVTKRAVEICKQNHIEKNGDCSSASLTKVNYRNVIDAFEELFHSKTVQVLKSLQKIEVLVMVALYTVTLHQKLERVPIDAVQDRVTAFLRNNLQWQNKIMTGAFREIVKRLHAFGLLTITEERQKLAESIQVSLKIYPDELATAFKDLDYVKKISELNEELRKLLQSVASIDDDDD